MLIVADQNIVFVKEAFRALGEVRLMRGREMTPAAVRDATLLLVRSVTPVNRALLEGSAVRFVATATIGTDHVDTTYLRKASVAFAATVNDPPSVPPGSSRARVPLETATVPALVKATPVSVTVSPASAWALKAPALLNVGAEEAPRSR